VASRGKEVIAWPPSQEERVVGILIDGVGVKVKFSVNRPGLDSADRQAKDQTFL
jgi:hypothetical protein